MNKIILICPYFGKLPRDRFQLTLNSCQKNPSINWLLITDDKTEFNYPSNVRVIYETWENFQQFVVAKCKSILGITTVLQRPYKLCDYKPLYGVLFEEYLEKFDFWGFTDLGDTIYGDLRSFLTDEILDRYDKINFLGHLTLLRNSVENNNRYKVKIGNGETLTQILTDNQQHAFDEQGFREIYTANDFPFVKINDLVADISPLRYAFQLSKYDDNFKQYYEPFTHRIFKWSQGKLVGYYLKNGELKTKEYGYVHFQKRKMLNHLSEARATNFLITPKGFVPTNAITPSLIKEYSPHKVYLPFFKLKWRALKSHFKASR